jgi:FMN reductase
MTTRKLAVVSAGLSEPSSTRLLADQLAAATRKSLEQKGFEVKIEVVELRDHAHDLTNNLLTGFPAGNLRKAIDQVVGADGLIAVSPIFNASYSGLFKLFFDVLETGSLAGEPVLMAATGGTARHSLALEHAMRPMFAYLRSVVVPTAVYAASEDWGMGGDAGHALTERIALAAGELATLVGAHPRSGQRDPFTDPTPFEDLLAGG